MSNTSVIDLVERTTKEFTRIEQNLPLRKAGLDRFIGIGYPTANDEDWRFTSLKPFTDLPFKPMIEPTNQAIEKSIIDGITFGEHDTDRLVFVDGHLSSELSQISKQKKILLLDAGNFFRGSTFGMADSGMTMIKWMNKNSYDAIVPGQEDFVFGIENINRLADNAEFPFLASNIRSNGKNSSFI